MRPWHVKIATCSRLTRCFYPRPVSFKFTLQHHFNNHIHNHHINNNHNSYTTTTTTTTLRSSQGEGSSVCRRAPD